MIVADANLIAYAILPGPQTSAALRVMARDAEWWAPPLWRSEVLNVLSTKVRLGDLALVQAQDAMSEALGLLAGREIAVDPGEVLAAAASAGHPSYDCEYVVLARGLGVPLVTADGKLLKRFPDVAVSLDAFVSA